MISDVEAIVDLKTKMAVQWSCIPSYRVMAFICGLTFIMPYLIMRQALYGRDLMDPRSRRHLSLNHDKNIYFLSQTKMPYSVWRALAVESNNAGYLIGNSTSLTFKPYSKTVDLRIIVIVFDRFASLAKCLQTIEKAEYYGDTVSLHVWIDRENGTENIDKNTYNVAQSFYFSHGDYHVHIQPRHVGIQGQWTNTWRPSSRSISQEVGLILEDDLTLSPYFWKWLRVAHSLYRNRSDVSGYGLSHPGMAHRTGMYLDIPLEYNNYLYKVICTWGFSPQRQSWRKFQEWFYEKEQDKSFEPLVPGILPTEWFLGEKQKHRERQLWEMWHIKYTHTSRPPQYNLLLNNLHEGLLAVNRHESGLHDQGRGVPTEPLCLQWTESYLNFTETPKFGYDGEIEV